MKNLLDKRHEIDEAAKKYNVAIWQQANFLVVANLIHSIYSLPIKHCMFNSIELSWARPEQYAQIIPFILKRFN